MASNKEAWLDVFRILLAMVLPPLAVFLQVGFNFHFWLNIVLTMLGFVPGIIHAFWVISRFGDEPKQEQ